MNEQCILNASHVNKSTNWQSFRLLVDITLTFNKKKRKKTRFHEVKKKKEEINDRVFSTQFYMFKKKDIC